MVSIRDYAKQKSVSYEAVRKQVQKYKEGELKEHIIKQNKTQYLDDYAVEFLDNKRKENPIIVVQMDKDEELERLSEENKRLLIKIAELQEVIIAKSEKIEQLQDTMLLQQKSEKKRWFWQKKGE